MNKRLFCVVVSAMSFLNSCDGSMAIGTKDGSRPTEFGRVAIDVDLDPVAVLGRSMEMSPRRLVFLFTSGGAARVSDTIEIHQGLKFSRTYELPSLRSWELAVSGYDQKDSILYVGYSSFRISPDSTTNVSLNLNPRFSTARARFPIEGDLTRFVLSIDGNVVGDSSVERWSRIGDTIMMSVDYIASLRDHRYSIKVYGKPWGTEVLLYSLDTTLVEGMLPTAHLVANWVGPMSPPPGAANLRINFDSIRKSEFIVEYDNPLGSDFGIPWNSSVSYGFFVDQRDGRKYRSIQVGSQTWMAEDLKFRGDGSVGRWSGDNPDTGMKYGALYSWSEAMGGTSDRNSECFWGVGEEMGTIVGDDGELVEVPRPYCLQGPSVWRGICPSGWHLPSPSEWGDLTRSFGDSAVWMLRAVGGWGEENRDGLDRVGFRALPNSYWWNSSNWWTSSEYWFLHRWATTVSAESAYLFGIAPLEQAQSGSEPKMFESAVRCVKD